MPLYEYICSDCRRRFEVLVRRISDPPAVTCERCRSARVRKLISGFSFGGGDTRGITGPNCNSCSRANCSDCS